MENALQCTVCTKIGGNGNETCIGSVTELPSLKYNPSSCTLRRVSGICALTEVRKPLRRRRRPVVFSAPGSPSPGKTAGEHRSGGRNASVRAANRMTINHRQAISWPGIRVSCVCIFFLGSIFLCLTCAFCGSKCFFYRENDESRMFGFLGHPFQTPTPTSTPNFDFNSIFNVNAKSTSNPTSTVTSTFNPRLQPPLQLPASTPTSPSNLQLHFQPPTFAVGVNHNFNPQLLLELQPLASAANPHLHMVACFVFCRGGNRRPGMGCLSSRPGRAEAPSKRDTKAKARYKGGARQE